MAVPNLSYFLRVSESSSYRRSGVLRETFIRKYTDHSASSKLFADAAREEVEEQSNDTRARSSKLTSIQGQYENWTGEESMQDAVLRMLVDKYKPLRRGTIMTADEKLKQTPPQINSDAVVTVVPHALANEPLLPAIEGHKPWHTTFKMPSHASPSVRLGSFSPLSGKPSNISVTDERTQRQEKALKKREEEVGRLNRARESTLDYRLGIKSPRGKGPFSGGANPVTMKGWKSLFEEKIEKARKEGHFKTVKGRGQPMERLPDEHNPFVAREEFLMNRIVQRNGAAPPWVEVQGELETAINSFREILRQSWIRRAIRTLTTSQPAALLPSLTLTEVSSLRDSEWEERERAYHETALEEINSLVRKYNGLAPYAVRRPYYLRSVELDKAYETSGEDILRELSERIKYRAASGWRGSGGSEEEAMNEGSGGDVGLPLKIRDIIRNWISRLLGR